MREDREGKVEQAEEKGETQEKRSTARQPKAKSIT